MTDKELIIDWLVQNESIAHDIIQKSLIKIQGVDPLFSEEAKKQEFEENKRLVICEISGAIGINPDVFNGAVEDVELQRYFERLK